jgi:hypothetical protein
MAHGGATGAVRRRAQERLAALVDPAITELAKLIRTADSDSVRISAIKDILDRAGYRPADKIEQATAVEIRVSYADMGPASPQTRRNGQDALNGH